jgi:hypothetical protein
MAITATSSGQARTPVPAGNYFGICIGVYDIGTQESQFGSKRQVILQFELHKKKGICRNDEGKPITISKFYNLAFNEKATLRKDVESMLGRKFNDDEARVGYDIAQLLEHPVRLVVENGTKADGSVKDAIKVFMPLDEDDAPPKVESNAVVYELNPDAEIPKTVPEWVAKKVNESKEMGGGSKGNSALGGHKAQAADDESDIVF